jgi:HEAT repeat protein
MRRRVSVSVICFGMLGLGLAGGLAGCGKGTADWLAELESDDASQRLHAIHALQERLSEAEVVVPALTKALHDPDVYVRRDAARGLARFGDAARAAVPQLQQALRDREPSVRRAARQALERIDPQALPPQLRKKK